MKRIILSIALLVVAAFFLPTLSFGYDEKDAYEDLQIASESYLAMNSAGSKTKREKLCKKGVHALLRVLGSKYYKGKVMEAVVTSGLVKFLGASFPPRC